MSSRREDPCRLAGVATSRSLGVEPKEATTKVVMVVKIAVVEAAELATSVMRRGI